MVNRVVATKLTEEEHSKLIDFCNGRGCTPSAFLREAINEMMNPIEKPKEEQRSKALTSEELRKYLGLKKE